MRAQTQVDDVDFAENTNTDDVQVEEYNYTIVSGALNRAHKNTCPMNSRATVKQHSKPLYEAGDYVYLHSKQLKNKHILCRVFSETRSKSL